MKLVAYQTGKQSQEYIAVPTLREGLPSAKRKSQSHAHQIERPRLAESEEYEIIYKEAYEAKISYSQKAGNGERKRLNSGKITDSLAIKHCEHVRQRFLKQHLPPISESIVKTKQVHLSDSGRLSVLEQNVLLHEEVERNPFALTLPARQRIDLPPLRSRQQACDLAKWNGLGTPGPLLNSCHLIDVPLEQEERSEKVIVDGSWVTKSLLYHCIKAIRNKQYVCLVFGVNFFGKVHLESRKVQKRLLVEVFHPVTRESYQLRLSITGLKALFGEENFKEISKLGSRAHFCEQLVRYLDIDEQQKLCLHCQAVNHLCSSSRVQRFQERVERLLKLQQISTMLNEPDENAEAFEIPLPQKRVSDLSVLFCAGVYLQSNYLIVRCISRPIDPSTVEVQLYFPMHSKSCRVNLPRSKVDDKISSLGSWKTLVDDIYVLKTSGAVSCSIYEYATTSYESSEVLRSTKSLGREVPCNLKVPMREIGEAVESTTFGLVSKGKRKACFIVECTLIQNELCYLLTGLTFPQQISIKLPLIHAIVILKSRGCLPDGEHSSWTFVAARLLNNALLVELDEGTGRCITRAIDNCLLVSQGTLLIRSVDNGNQVETDSTAQYSVFLQLAHLRFDISFSTSSTAENQENRTRHTHHQLPQPETTALVDILSTLSKIEIQIQLEEVFSSFRVLVSPQSEQQEVIME